MDNMLFPENGPSLVIVPSNKEGTGFLNHCYDARYLKDFISESQFNSIVLLCSKRASQCYSQKKILDKKGVDRWVKWTLITATLMAMVSIYTVLDGFLGGEDSILLYLSHLIIAPSLCLVLIVSSVNWKMPIKKSKTFNEMVKLDLDYFFKEINPEFK